MICSFEKIATPSHLYGLVSYRGRPPVSLAIASGGNSNLFQALIVSCALWCLSVSLQVPWYCTKLSFALCGSQASKVYWFTACTWIQQDRNRFLGQFSESLEHWTYAPFFSFLPREKLLVGLFVLLRYAGLELLWLVWNGFPHLFQCDCSWVWTCLGYCDFLVGFWSSHKDFWGHILLTWHLCGEMKSRASYFAVWLMSCLFLRAPRPGNLPQCPSAETTGL